MPESQLHCFRLGLRACRNGAGPVCGAASSASHRPRSERARLTPPQRRRKLELVEAAIIVRDLRKRFGAVAALDGVSFEVQPGVTGLLGPNGAGKTTLLRILTGSLRPDSGTVRALGMEVLRSPVEARHRMGYAPEGDCHIPGLAAIDEVYYMARLNGLGHAEALRASHDALAYVELDEARYRKVETFSTGMKQRVKLACAVVHRPPLIFLDEPTSGLDPAGREQILSLIRRLGDSGATVILSTHILSDVTAVCSHAVVVFEGRVLKAGSVADLTAPDLPVMQVEFTGQADRVLVALQAKGCAARLVGENRLRVEGGDGAVSLRIFTAAHECGVAVRRLVPERQRIEEIFQKRMQG